MISDCTSSLKSHLQRRHPGCEDLRKFVKLQQYFDSLRKITVQRIAPLPVLGVPDSEEPDIKPKVGDRIKIEYIFFKL